MKMRFSIPIVFLAVTLQWANAEDVVILQLEKKGIPLEPVVIEVFEADAPKHAANFKKLMAEGFYRRTAVHRVLNGALVQMGDPLSRRKDTTDLGTGGPGYTLPAEIKRKHSAGTVAMGRLPNQINPTRRSNGSQFYVAVKPLPELDGSDTVFGRVVQGEEVFAELAKVATDTNDSPVERVTVRRTKVVPRENVAQEVSALKKGGGGWLRRVFGFIPKLF